MSSYEEERAQALAVAPDDGPVVRELKAILSGWEGEAEAAAPVAAIAELTSRTIPDARWAPIRARREVRRNVERERRRQARVLMLVRMFVFLILVGLAVLSWYRLGVPGPVQ